MKLSLLKLTQEALRKEKQIDSMITYVKAGGKFTLSTLSEYQKKLEVFNRPSLISINEFEDGDLYVRDGHHRIGGIWLAGRDFLYEDEYVIEKYTYSEYMEINFELRYVTPFDPRTQVRLESFFSFREEVMDIFNELGEDKAVAYIRSNSNRYCLPRRLPNSIEALFSRFSGVI